jgi:2-amino-4-hydroxy-6-hydroxymethyldihydropteridine diphosphokinase
MSIPPGRSLHQAAIALGSNLGDSRSTLESTLTILDTLPEIRVQARSPFYITQAVGPPQPDFLNSCAVVSTSLSPEQLLKTLLQVEAQFGRVRREKWGARTLDLDLLLFDDLILKQPNLQIPHPCMAERAFVLVPLNDIAADWIEPVSGKTIASLLQTVDCSGVRPLSESS